MKETSRSAAAALVGLALAGLLGSGFGRVWAREDPPPQGSDGQEKKDDPPPEAAPAPAVELQNPSRTRTSLSAPQDVLDLLIGVAALPGVGGSWVSQGPGPINNGQVEGITNRPVVGAVHTILAHPANANVLWIGAVNGGLWKTTDALSASPTWTALGDGLGSLSIGAMDLDPNDSTSNTIVAGFGRFSSFSSIGGPRAGIVRTTDGGNTWTTLGVSTLSGKNISGVAARGALIVTSVNLADSFTCSNIGIFRSDDTGFTFTKISGAAGSGLPGGRAFDLVGDPINPFTLYTAIKDTPTCTPPLNSNGVYRSSDGGVTWTKVNNAAIDALVANDATLSNIEMAVGRSSEVYAAIVVSGRLAGLFRSGNFGASWSQLDNPQTTDGGVVNGIHPGGQGATHLSVAADPINPNLVYIGGDRQPSPFPNALGSTNFSGRLFRVDALQPAGSQARSLTNCPAVTAACPSVSTTSNSSPHADSREMVVAANGDVIESDDGGLYRRTNPSGIGNWQSVMGNLRLTEMHDVAYDSVSNMILAGAQDVGTAEQTSVGGTTWNEVNQGDGGDVQVDDISSPTQSTRYTSSQNLGSFFRRVVNNLGVTISSAFPALLVSPPGPALVPRFVTPVEVNALPSALPGSRLLIAGSNDLYESLTRGDTITALGWNRAATAMVYGGRSGGVNNPDVIYAINGNLAFVRTAAGLGLVQTPTAPGTSTLRDIAIDSSDWTKAYVINSIGQVFATSNAGGTWTNVTGNLGSGSVDLRTIVFVPGTANAIMVGGQGGVFQMATGSPGSWNQFGTGMPNVLVFDMDYDQADDVLVAGTLGRGAWKITGVSGVVPSGLSIGDVSLTEGNAGTTNAVFTVTLSTANAQTVTVNFATADGTATAGADYVATSGSVSFPPGTTSQTVSVPVIGDTLIEGNETFFVNLSNPTNATISDGQGQATILDDDAGAIAGTVSAEAGGAPLSSVTVQVYNSTGIFVASASSNASGSYTVANLGPGSYFARTFNSLGYVDELYDNFACAPCTITSGTPITVSPGATTAVNFALAAGGRISGTVTDTGTPPLPLSNVSVQVYSASGVFITSRSTDSSGNYTILAGLPSGSYRVRTFNSLGYIDELFDDIVCAPCSVTAGAPVPVTAPATTAGINFALLRGGRVAGNVTAANGGAALSGVSVQIFNAAGTFVTSGSSDGSGNYTSGAGLPTGTYFARTSGAPGYLDELYDNLGCSFSCLVTNGAPIGVTAPATTGGVNFALLQGGRITGSVVAAATAAPLAGVPVEIYDSTGLLVSTPTTSSAGIYTTIGLPAGSYFVRTRNLLGFVDEVYNDTTCAPCTPTDGTPVAVTAGATTSGISFALDKGGRVSGLVTDASGAPLSGVGVRIHSASGVLVTTATTNAAGGYLTTGLPTGSYFAKTSNSLGYVDELFDDIACLSCDVTTGRAIPVSAGATSGGVDFALAAGGRISGSVSDSNGGAPLSGVTVNVYDASGGLVTSGVTDGLGHYVSGTGLLTGTYFARTSNGLGYFEELYDDIFCLSCSVTTGTPISVTVGATTSGVDFSLVRGGRIAGIVTDSATGQFLPGVTVQVYTAAGTLIVSSTGSSLTGGYGTPALAPGNYFVRTSNSLGYINELHNDIPCNSCNVTGGTPVAVTTGTTRVVNFALDRGGRVAGTVTDERTLSPLAGVAVQVYDATGSLVSTATTNAAGGYTSGAGLPTGSYFARTANSVGYLDELYNEQPCSPSCSATTGFAIGVTAGSTTNGINFTLTAGGRVSGTVTDVGTGQPIANVNIQVYNSSGSLVSSALSDGSGNYTSGAGLLAGTYYARTSTGLGYLNQLYDSLACTPCTVTSGTPIAVSDAATTTGIDFALTRGGQVAGHVTDEASGVPLAGITVAIYGSSGSLVTSLSTNLSGAYTSLGIRTASYFVKTQNALGYADELYNDILCSSCAVTAGSPVGVVEGATTPGIDFALFNGPTLSIGPATVTEGNGGTTNAVFTVTLSRPATSTVMVDFATANGTAEARSDYSSQSGTLSFAPGVTSQTVTVEVIGDLLNEPDETFFVRLSNPRNARIETGQGVGTILNDDPVPSASIADVTVAEGDSGQTSAVFNVTLSAPSGQTVTVSFATADGTATAGADYAPTSGSLTFPPGTTNQSLTVLVNGDTLDEDDETFFVNLTGGTNVDVPSGTRGTATIIDDDAAPTLSIDNVTLTEGDAGTTNAVFTVTLSAASGKTVSVGFATADGTTQAGSDYVSASGTLSFAPGTTSQTVTVEVKGDLLNEPDETFFVNLSGATNATIATSQGTATILNDDPVPSLSIDSVALAEGTGGTTSASFTVTLSAPSGQLVTVNFATADGTATAGSDYAGQSGTLSFPPGTTSQTVTALVNADALNEPNETFFVNLSGPANASISTSQGTATILNDDPPPSLSIDDVTVREPHTGTTDAVFTVSLSSASGQAVTVAFATADGTANAGIDYRAASGTLTFPPGTTTQTLAVAVLSDRRHEGPETFFVRLSEAANATLGRGQGVATILPPLPLLSIDDVTVKEADDEHDDEHRGEHGDRQRTAVFKVTLSRASSSNVSVDFATADGTATAGSDYTATSGRLTFQQGVKLQTISVLVRGESAAQPTETFFVNLTNASGATIQKGQGVCTIPSEDERRDRERER